MSYRLGWITRTPSSWPFSLPAAQTIGTISTNTLNAIAADSNEQFSIPKVLSSWGTAAVVKIKAGGVVTDILYVIFGGGHGDTANDAVYAFRFSTGLFEKLLAPSAAAVALMATQSAAVTSDTTHGENIAGRPDSQHAYQHMHGLDSDEAGGPAFMQLCGYAIGQGAIACAQAHRFDAVAKTWARFGDIGISANVRAVIKDTSRGKFVRFPSNNGTTYDDIAYNGTTWASHTQTTRIGNWSDSAEATGIYDPVRDLYIAGNMGGPGSNLCAIAAGSPTGAWTELTFTANATLTAITGVSRPNPVLTGTYGNGLQYRAANDTFLMVDNSSATPTGVWVLTPPTSSPLTNAWTWSRIAFTGTSNFSSDLENRDHMNRFRYLDIFDALVVCPAAGSAMECWKL